MKAKETFTFSKWNVEVHRRSFRRSLSIQLYPDKPIKVIAAQGVSQKFILDFLLAKETWIERTFQKFSVERKKFPDKKIRATERFPFLGVAKGLKIVITLNKKSFVSVTEEHLLLHIPRDQWSAEALSEEHPGALQELRHFYKREATSFLTERVEFWANQMGLFPQQLKFREPKTRWGSCSSQKCINLNWRLIVFKPEIIDYVVVHELAHLQHMNHSEKFWDLVARYVSNYKELSRQLKESQSMVEFLSESKI